MDPKRLRQETRSEHEAVEAMLPLTDRGLTRQRYREVLLCFHQVVCPWEQWSERHAPAAVRPLLTARRRCRLLEEDLQFLGGFVASNNAADPPFPADRIPGLEVHEASGEPFLAAFLGAMYVVEGSSLGGQYVARAVEDQLRLTPGQGSAYFRGHGSETMPRWREFQAVLSELPDQWGDKAIAAAHAMFGVFGDAFRSCSAGRTGEPAEADATSSTKPRMQGRLTTEPHPSKAFQP